VKKFDRVTANSIWPKFKMAAAAIFIGVVRWCKTTT